VIRLFHRLRYRSWPLDNVLMNLILPEKN